MMQALLFRSASLALSSFSTSSYDFANPALSGRELNSCSWTSLFRTVVRHPERRVSRKQRGRQNKSFTTRTSDKISHLFDGIFGKTRTPLCVRDFVMKSILLCWRGLKFSFKKMFQILCRPNHQLKIVLILEVRSLRVSQSHGGERVGCVRVYYKST